ncbi:MAG: hypothetical protein KAS32_02445 [Candidatus Peribacteraceae bacterium]|nr:hypothetical protein [Candidatus Peribacteraceae bacterium]
MGVDENIIQAVDNWRKYGLPPGSCTELLLRGEYEEAYLHAHPLIKPHWRDHLIYIEDLPEEFRGINYDTWKGELNE